MYTDKQPRTRSSRTFRTEAGKSSVYVQDNRPENAVQAKLANLIQLVTDDTYVYPLREKYILVKRMLKESRGGYTDKNVADMLKEVPKKEMDMILSWDSSYIQQLRWNTEAIDILKTPENYMPNKDIKIGDILREENFTEADYIDISGVATDVFLGIQFQTLTPEQETILKRNKISLAKPSDDPTRWEKELQDFEKKFSCLSSQDKQKFMPANLGNCGAMAEFLFRRGGGFAQGRKQSKAETKHQDMLKEICKIIQASKGGLLKVQLKSSHVFTLIINEDQIELIQAWQDLYSVAQSLRANTFYTKDAFIEYFQNVFDLTKREEAVNTLFDPRTDPTRKPIKLQDEEEIKDYKYKPIEIHAYRNRLRSAIKRKRGN